MKLLYIISGTNLGGATFSFLTLLEYGISIGHSAVVIIPDDRQEFVNRLQTLHVRYYVVPMNFDSWPYFIGKRRIFKYLMILLQERIKQYKSRQAVFQIIKSESPDIVHTNVSPIDVGYFAARTIKIPHVWHIREYCDRDFDIHMFPSKKVFRRRLRKSFSICITKDLQVYNHLNDLSQCRVIYNGVRNRNNVFFKEKKDKFFLCASRISKEKDQERSIRVFAEFLKYYPDWKLVILGQGNEWYEEHCKQVASNLNIEDNVVFAGFSNDVDSYMRDASALLVASTSEGFGRMTAEAAFSGCLVIGYNAAGTKEILDEIGGLLWHSDTEYLEAMKTVASMSRDQYREIAIQAQKKACQLYSIESYVKQVFDFYETIS